jgi:hypothetical protein
MYGNQPMFNNQNMGYGNPQQPMMFAPPPPPVYYPPQNQPQQIILINGGGNNQSNGANCPACGTSTPNIPRKTVGCGTITWCVILFIATGFLCCIPFCMDGCKDTELVCSKCQMVKTTIQANIC